jgi:hypothetical protein
MRRRAIYLVIAVVVITAGIVVGDLLVTTEEERLTVFADAVSGEVTPARIDAALAWCDPARQPVQVESFAGGRLYEDEASLHREARRALSRFRGTELHRLSDSITVHDDTATVSLRLLATDRGFINAEFELRRHGEDWLVSSVVVRR